MESSRDAVTHIQRLRRELDPQCHPRLASVMASAVDLIVNQLYDRSTHFILEFLQNMDDTKYEDSVNPTVKFTYTRGRLRIDSNQIGFSAKDVDAICDIGSSTKVNELEFMQSIGEKGIGFKSVFRVANKVWLSSRNYSIRWDRNAKFGAMVPEWAKFPESVVDGQTSFLCELDGDEQPQQISKDLETFDASLILFLKKIRHVIIEVHRINGQIWTKSVVRTDTQNVDSHTSVIQDGDVELSYLRSTFIATNLPNEARRRGRSSSELILAFPLQRNSNVAPSATTQNVYSGLPIGNHGLRFILNADFILTASRQNIDVSLPWNLALRDALPLAWIDALHHLSDSLCKYTWPWYATAATPSAFFQPALKTMRRILVSRRILESSDGQLRLPGELTYVDPTRFACDDGGPMSLSKSTKACYLSVEYPTWTIDSILDLGVSRLTNEGFLRDLHELITGDPDGYHRRPPKWHETLAAVLLPQVDVLELREAIRQLEIIPLVDGSWTNSVIPEGRRTPKPVFWPTNIDLYGSEAKLPFSVVDSKSLGDIQRRKLFERLDIETLDSERICDGIIAAHAAAGPRFGLRQLISHAHLLHREFWIPKTHQEPELWFVSSSGLRQRGSDLYAVTENESSTQSKGVSGILQSMSPQLHRNYFMTGDLRHHSVDSSRGHTTASLEDFVAFLNRTFHVSTVPRLVETGENACYYDLAADFEYLFQTHHATHIFQLILDNWDFYSRWIELDGLHRKCEMCLASRAKLLEHISELPSQPEHGKKIKILDLVLPDIDPFIQDAGVPLATVKVSNCEDSAVRYRLQCLGIITRRSFEFYLQCLNAMKRRGNPSEQQLVHVYQQVQTHYKDGRAQVEHAFLRNDMVYLDVESPISGEVFRGWTNISHCIKLGIRLEKIYPRSADLFRALQSADGLRVDELITGLISVSDAFTNDLLPSLIKSLSQLSKAIASLSNLGIQTTLESLRSRHIFPISIGALSSSPELRSSEDANWYIADRPHLRDSFMRYVPLLHVSTHEADQMEDLFGCLRVRGRKLSLCASTETVPQGPIKLRASDTAIIQSRAPFFEALVPTSHWSKGAVWSYIHNATVSSAASIIDRHSLEASNEHHIQGEDTGSQAVWRIEDGQLRLFISAKSPSAVPLIHLSEHLLQYCGVEDPLHMWLLHVLLTEPDYDAIETAFAKRGVRVKTPKRLRDNDQSLEENSFWKYASSSMNLPGPSAFRDSDAENTLAESSTHGLLQNFHSREDRHHQGDHQKPENDRRLNLMRHCWKNDSEVEMFSSTDTLRGEVDTNLELKYLGELLVSSFFQRELGTYYDPGQCWTSPLRARAGFPEFCDSTHHASFTLSGKGIAEKVTELLYNHGCKSLPLSSTGLPAYHFDVGISVGGMDDTFEWGTSQLQMAHEYRHEDPQTATNSSQNNILVLMRITDAYTKPNISLFADPWSYFRSGILRLRPDRVLPASLISMQHHPKQVYTTRSHSTMPNLQLDACDVSTRQYGQDHETTSSLDASIFQPVRYNESESLPRDPLSRERERGHPLSSVSRKRKRSPDLCHDNTEVCSPTTTIGPATVFHHYYQYGQLLKHEMRLFTLFPGEATETLQGILWTTTSTGAGPYITLSYVWGPEHQPMHVLKTPSGNLDVRDGLYEALTKLRQKRTPLTLWVDALCINQADKREKVQQIALLAEIFQKSVSTIAFIDGGDKHSEAIQMLMQVRTRMVLGPSSDEWLEDLPRCPALWEARGMPFPEDGIWAKVSAFFSNPWFRRAWIVQEAVIARRLLVLHGKTRVDWNHLFLVMDHINRELEGTEGTDSNSWVPFLKLGKLRHLEDRSGRASILKLLENFRHAKSSDPRDKFFSLLGIASDGNLEEFQPDYSVSADEIAQRFATALLRRFSEKRQAMLLLYRAGLSQSEDLPSWVPGWLEDKPNGLHDVLGRGNAFNACGDLPEQIKYVPEKGELEVKACLVDEVENVTRSCNGIDRSEQRRYFTEVNSLVPEVFGTELDDEEIRRVLWEVPIAGAKHPKVALPGDLSIEKSWEAFMSLLKVDRWRGKSGEQTLQGSERCPTGEDDNVLTTKSRVYQSLLADEVRGWRFVTLKGRNMCGIAPNNVQEGDVIHIFHGGVVPFVTRRSEEREGAYRLIGQCYIWGLMQGEGTRYDGLIDRTVRLH